MKDFTNYECEGQMDIFDFLQQDEFNTMTLKDAAAYLSKKTGLKFKQVSWMKTDGDEALMYEAKKKDVVVNIAFSHYAPEVREGKRFLGVDVDQKKWPYHGASSPCESMEEALTFLQKRLNEIEKGEY